jgi:Flp pilus assembly protein TadG
LWNKVRSVRHNDEGASAIEFAVLAPLVAFLSLAIYDAWSFATFAINMQATVTRASNIVLQGGSDDTAIKAAVLSQWVEKPADASLDLTRVFKCGTQVVSTSTMTCTSGDPPEQYASIAISGTWVPPVASYIFPIKQALNRVHTLRIR